MVPFSRLDEISNEFNETSLAKDVGKDPLSLLKDTSNCVKDVSRPMEEGKSPCNPYPRNTSDVTDVPLAQVIPVHEQKLGAYDTNTGRLLLLSLDAFWVVVQFHPMPVLRTVTVM